MTTVRRGRLLRRLLPLAAALGTVLAVAGPTGAGNAQPVAESGSSDWRTVTTGGFHSCGIRTSRQLYCWGRDDSGQVGDGGSNADQAAPVPVGGANWASVDAGVAHTCGLTTTRRVFCWGSDEYGALGDGGADANQSVPVEVAGGHTTWTSVSVGGSHACGRRTNGRLYCWGYDGSGELGDGGSVPGTNRPTPSLVAGGATNWTAVSAGGAHTCGRRANGRLYCWGNDSDSQVGDGGTTTDRAAPVLVAGGATDWASVSAGGFHTCGRRTTGRVYCWGEDDDGQLGDSNTLDDQLVPALIVGGALDWTSVSAGSSHTCGRLGSGRLYCWGADDDSALGNGGTDTDSPVPSQIAGGATDWTSVSAGLTHTCARTTAGRLYCWGADGDGQLGNGGTTGDQGRPSEVFAP